MFLYSRLNINLQQNLCLTAERPSDLDFSSLFLQQKKKVFLTDLKKAGITIMWTKMD